MQSVLLIDAPLLSKPSEDLPIFALSMFATKDYKLECVVLTEKDYRDIFWNHLRRHFLYDYISDLVFPEDRVAGITLESGPNYSLDIITDKIVFDNLPKILRQIEILSKY